ncbi:DUF523 domain-containing protein [Dendrosporobacter sp. 1207_IL3150]|uniref:DUF523 domain-containing protein n=1 Tax=Dendrosporobacter sp. 1207_IL3150 TaxID=3084054 RepID=UPI002FD8C0A7
MIIVSSCLLGYESRYDGGSNSNPLLMKYLSRGKFIPVCPEQLGGLSTPRCPAEIINGCGGEVLVGKAKVQGKHGDDFTKGFVCGARQVLDLANKHSVKAAILKERSPSCGANYIYDGSFSRTIKSGKGITAALLSDNNIVVYSEEEITDEVLLGLLE